MDSEVEAAATPYTTDDLKLQRPVRCGYNVRMKQGLESVLKSKVSFGVIPGSHYPTVS